MSDTKFRIVSGERLHRGLATDRFLKGINTEQWSERHPDHFVIIHDDKALAFVTTLPQVFFQLEEAEKQHMHAERLAVYFIHEDPDHRRERVQAAQDAGTASHEMLDVETKIAFIEEKLRGADKERAVADINESCSIQDWQAILVEIIRTGNAPFLSLLDDLPLNIDEADLWTAKKVMDDIQKAFPEPQI